MTVGREIAYADAAFDNLDDMVRHVELTGRAEGWSKNLIERIIKRLTARYKTYNRNRRINDIAIQDVLIDVGEQFSGDIDMMIEYAQHLAVMYDWTDDFKERVIKAIEDKYA
jgi:hypothetical protein